MFSIISAPAKTTFKLIGGLKRGQGAAEMASVIPTGVATPFVASQRRGLSFLFTQQWNEYVSVSKIGC
jgi:hypothetical protein